MLKVTDSGLLVAPTVVEEKVSVEGDQLATGAGAGVPVPTSAMFWGLDEVLSAMLSVPVREPEAVGLKETFIVQFPPALREVPQLSV